MVLYCSACVDGSFLLQTIPISGKLREIVIDAPTAMIHDKKLARTKVAGHFLYLHPDLKNR
jgi:hypothetical protein